MPVAMIFDSGQTYSGRAYRDAIAAAHAHRIPVLLARRGMRWSSGDGVSLNVLAPSLPFLADTGDDVNENSIVVMLHYRDFHELFMGRRRSERSSTTRAGRRPSSGGRESRPSWIALRLDARIHRRSPPSDRDHLSRPTQYVRSSSADDHRSVASFRRRNLAYRPMWGDLVRRSRLANNHSTMPCRRKLAGQRSRDDRGILE
jgi:hypothetical protein